MPVLGNMCDSRFVSLFYAAVRDILSAQLYRTAGDSVKSRYTVNKLRLSVAVNTGNADYFARADIKADSSDGIVFMKIARNGKILYFENIFAWLGIVLLNFKLNGSADHHVGQLLFCNIGGIYRTYALTLTKNRYPVGNRHDFVEFMCYKQNRFTFFGKPAHYLHQVVYLLRSKDCGRLVENENLVVAVEHFQNLDTLLHSDGDIFYFCVEIDL